MVGSGSFCAVALCNNSWTRSRREGSNISFHRFPKETALRNEWVIRCKRADRFNYDTSKVCSSHFPPEAFERDLKAELLKIQPRRKLKQNTIPTLNLPGHFKTEMAKDKQEDELCPSAVYPVEISRSTKEREHETYDSLGYKTLYEQMLKKCTRFEKICKKQTLQLNHMKRMNSLISRATNEKILKLKLSYMKAKIRYLKQQLAETRRV